jgi:hypothetical protein
MLTFPRKQIRAAVIAQYIERAGYRGAVCFSCGHASAALQRAGVYVVDISETGDLIARSWWHAADIRRAWPDLLDATCGHLPAPLMGELATAYRVSIGALGEASYDVPTGSGETMICLSMAYPGVRFVPKYDLDAATAYHDRAPLNRLVTALAQERGDRDGIDL